MSDYDHKKPTKKKQYGMIKCPGCGEKWKIRTDDGKYYECSKCDRLFNVKRGRK